MKIKQTSLFVLGLLFLSSALLGTLVLPVDSAQALTKKEWQECQDKWQGTTMVNDPASRAAWKKFTDSKCYVSNGGNCSSTQSGSGTFATVKADCPISDKYIKQAASSGSDGGDSANISNPVEGTDCGGVDTAIIKCDAKNSGSTEDNGIWALLLLVLNILTAGVGIVAVGGIVYGSILYTTAEDKADQVKKATDIITNVVIGLVLFALMYGLLNFIVPGGVFA